MVPKVEGETGEHADDVAVHGRRGLRLSPDQRPWKLSLRRRVGSSVGVGNPTRAPLDGATS